MGAEGIAVVGTGYVGRQICLLAAMHGFQVWGRDVAPERLAAAREFADGYLAARVRQGKLDEETADASRERLHYTLDLEQAVSSAEFFIEAVTENVGVKRQAIRELDRLVPATHVLGSNSSMIASSLLVEGLRHPERVCNVHFFNPVVVMKLVEVVQGLHTSDATIDKAMALASALGKTPVLLRRECRGFVVNRVMMALLREALSLVEEGVASPEDVDRAIEAGLNHPMGPFRLMDLIGLDFVCDTLAERELQDAETSVPAGVHDGDIPAPLREMREAGKLGRRTGSGFYEY